MPYDLAIAACNRTYRSRRKLLICQKIVYFWSVDELCHSFRQYIYFLRGFLHVGFLNMLMTAVDYRYTYITSLFVTRARISLHQPQRWKEQLTDHQMLRSPLCSGFMGLVKLMFPGICLFYYYYYYYYLWQSLSGFSICINFRELTLPASRMTSQ